MQPGAQYEVSSKIRQLLLINRNTICSRPRGINSPNSVAKVSNLSQQHLVCLFRVLPCLALPRPVYPCPVLSCLALSCLAMPCRAMLFFFFFLFLFFPNIFNNTITSNIHKYIRCNLLLTVQRTPRVRLGAQAPWEWSPG